MLPVKIPQDLIEKIPGPINDNNIVDLVLKIRKSSDEGKDHLLYQEWINKYNMWLWKRSWIVFSISRRC